MITYSKLQAIWDAYNDFRIYDFGEALKVKEFLSREENKDLSVDQALIELGMESEGDAPWYNVVIECIDSGKYNLDDESCVEPIVNEVLKYCKTYNKSNISKSLVECFVKELLLFKEYE